VLKSKIRPNLLTCIILHPLRMSQNIQALALQSHALVGLEILGARLDDGRGSGGAVGGRVEGDDGEGCGHWEGFVEGGKDGGGEEESCGEGCEVHGWSGDEVGVGFGVLKIGWGLYCEVVGLVVMCRVWWCMVEEGWCG
jgi:hypothetical protein